TFHIAISTVAIAPVAVPIIRLVFLRLHHAMDLFVHHTADVVSLGHAVQRRDDVDKTPHLSPRLEMKKASRSIARFVGGNPGCGCRRALAMSSARGRTHTYHAGCAQGRMLEATAAGIGFSDHVPGLGRGLAKQTVAAILFH